MFARPAVRLARQTVGRRSASTNPDAIQHFENTAYTSWPFQGFAVRRPVLFNVLMLSTCGAFFALPFGVWQYQLSKQKKHLWWYNEEEL